jgi:hypothetical protein
MAIACAEADAALIATLRSKFGSVVAIRGSPSIIRDGDVSVGLGGSRAPPERVSPTIYLVTLESPLISEDTPHVEIIVDGSGVRFKPWREV